MLILPVIAILIVYLDVSLSMGYASDKCKKCRTLSALYSISFNTLIVLISNEILSLFHLINFASFSLLWFAVDLAAVFILIVILRKRKISLSEVKSLFSFPKSFFNPVILITLFVCGTAVYMAIRIVPYNWDSMTYHLTRIVHWAQNGSVAHYVCHDISQISCPPLAEFVNLHVYILSGCNDYLVNLLQTFSYIISVFLVYKISEKIGCSRLFRSLAALTFATTPIVFGEALSTQVDVFSGLWLLVYVYGILNFTDLNRKLHWDQDMICKLLLIGISAGFCYLAKPSVVIGAFVFAVWLLIICVYRKDNILIVVRSVIVVAVASMIIALPEMIRNLITFHSIAEKSAGAGFLVPSWDIRYLIENMVQNVGFNLPNKYLNVSSFVEKVVFKMAYILYTGTQVPEGLLNFRLIDAGMNHDTAINPTITWLMIIAVLCGIVVVIIRMVRKSVDLKQNISYGYLITAITSILAFCAVVNWYLFITRYEVGYFAIIAPAVMLAFQYIFSQSRRLVYSFAGIIVFISVITFADAVEYHKNNFAAGDNRIVQYFAVRGEFYSPYTVVTGEIIEDGYENIGFVCDEDSYEYPLWKMMEGSISRFEHVCVMNETEIYDDVDFIPECIIVVNVEVEDMIKYHNTDYELALDAEGVKLFIYR